MHKAKTWACAQALLRNMCVPIYDFYLYKIYLVPISDLQIVVQPGSLAARNYQSWQK